MFILFLSTGALYYRGQVSSFSSHSPLSIDCRGSESSLRQCRFINNGTCELNQLAGVSCSGEMKYIYLLWTPVTINRCFIS